jgi:hypothetical protein
VQTFCTSLRFASLACGFRVRSSAICAHLLGGDIFVFDVSRCKVVAKDRSFGHFGPTERVRLSAFHNVKSFLRTVALGVLAYMESLYAQNTQRNGP